jgi:hypothetical protein
MTHEAFSSTQNSEVDILDQIRFIDEWIVNLRQRRKNLSEDLLRLQRSASNPLMPKVNED